MAEISLRDIEKSYGNVEVIKGVNMDIKDGEFMVIVGPSGCGKSTLLRMVAGLEAISAGEISIGGRVVNELEPAERDIAMVFQNYALYPHMSVYKNMAYGLKIKKIPSDEIERRVNRAAEILELGDYLNRSPRQLSGGQRQRVAMGRAIVREPAVFLFDEPLSNLDAKLRVQMRLEIKKLQATLGITAIYVTHDQVEAMTLGHRLAVVNGGVIEQIGTPIEIYERPETVFVAGFIGSPSMNLIDGEMDDTGGKVLLGGGAQIALATANAALAGHAVIFGARPEHLDVTSADNASLTLTVNIVEQLGADTLVHGTLKGGAEAVIRLDGIQTHKSGEEIGLNIEPAKMHLFAADTGKRLQ
ncbi:MAG: sn-glycerol-3-phosphate import ATP-binding protein UgpC [Alphaproteobacteria bacterium]|nr:sn-glycerol-3-phosphate import ATP-binding protein UgpC [Alphaproteobacteria bacterium]